MRILMAAPGLGLETTLHWLPFQCSISVSDGLSVPWLLYDPTAQTSLVELAATPYRLLNEPPGLGLLTRLHFVPFQCSIIVPRPSPTAQASLAEIAATEDNPPIPRRMLGEIAPLPSPASRLTGLELACPFLAAIPLAPTIGRDQALRKMTTIHTSTVTLSNCFIVHPPCLELLNHTHPADSNSNFFGSGYIALKRTYLLLLTELFHPAKRASQGYPNLRCADHHLRLARQFSVQLAIEEIDATGSL